jgi:hypothetical protein
LKRPYGFWRPYLKKVIDRYLECGDLHHGLARVKCRDGHHEYLLAFVLKQSGNPALAGQAPSFLPLLPSEAGGGIRGMALFLRAQEGSPPAFRLQPPEDPAAVFSRSLSPTRSGNRHFLSHLSRCAWESLKLFLQQAVPERTPLPGAAIAIQTFANSLNISACNH